MAAVVVFPESDAIPEGSSPTFTLTLMETDGTTPVDADDIEAIYLTLRDLGSNQIVNSRDAVNVKNGNGGTLTDGAFSMQFDEADMIAIGPAIRQKRRLTLDFRLVGGGRLTREIIFPVKSMPDISPVA